MPDNPLPYFPLYVDDFVSDGKVEAMTTLEVGAYILLLCKAWKEQPRGSLPNDDVTLARWARLGPDHWSTAKHRVLAPFQLRADNRWHQKRMELEYRKLVDSTSKRRKAGQKGAQSRWQTQCDRIGIANAIALRNQCHSDSDSDSDSEKKNTGEESPVTPLAPRPEDRPAEQAARASEGKTVSPPTARAGDPAAGDGDPVVLTFPTVGRGPAEWHLRASKLREWGDSYPGLDALAECRKALQWCRDNPRNRKTARGMTTFLGRWLSKAQDSVPKPRGLLDDPQSRPVGGRPGRIEAPPGKYDRIGTTLGTGETAAASQRNGPLAPPQAPGAGGD